MLMPSIAGLVGMVAALWPAWALANVFFNENFESGVLRSVSGYTTSGNPPTITTERSRAGRYAMKSYLNRQTSSNSYRTEISIGTTNQTFIGSERWYGFSIFLPSSYVPSPIWEIVAQWHDRPNDWDKGRKNPPLHLATSRGGKPGRWTIANLWDAQPVAADGSYTIDDSIVWDLGPYETNKWTDWVFRIKWSYRSDGILQVWKDGKLVVNRTGPNTYNDNLGPYMKMGIYKGWSNRSTPTDTVHERTLYHDEVRIADESGSYAAVAPGGGGTAVPLLVPMAPSAVEVE